MSSTDRGSPDHGAPDHGVPDHGVPDHGAPDHGADAAAEHGLREAREHEPAHRPWIGAILAAALAAVLAAAMAGLPDDRVPLPPVARQALEVALPRWGLTEPVNEVVYGTRGFDTFGETFLLLAAVVSVVVITRSREPRRGYFGESAAGAREQAEDDPDRPPDASEREARSAGRRERDEEAGGPRTPDAEPLGTPAPETAEAMTVVTRTAIRVALPLLMVAGLYLAAWGYSPGGGFPAGAVLAGGLLLAYAAFGRRMVARVARPAVLETAEMIGAAAIIGTELLGLLLRGSFSANWLPLAQPQTPLSGGVAQLFSGSELIEVSTGLAIAIFSLIGIGRDWARPRKNRTPGSNAPAPAAPARDQEAAR